MADILVIEDEINIAELIKYNLEMDGHRIRMASDGESGLRMAKKESVDLLILDLMLPKVDGLDILRELRQSAKTSSLPVLMLTAKGTEADKVLGLELGADDYMVKPFSVRELSARVKSILRRSGSSGQSRLLRAGSVTMNLDTHDVTVNGQELTLTSKEFNLLKTLIESKGRILGREELLERVWGYDDAIRIETRTVDIHIGHLRKKLGSESVRIKTITNEGYRLDQDD